MVVYSGQRFNASDKDLTTAKEQAFESIHSLWQARAVAYLAMADLNRVPKDDVSFQAKVSEVRGHLGNELHNLTFEGEEQAARETEAAFSRYAADKTPESFRAFDKSLGETLRINQQAFDAAVDRGLKDVSGFEIAIPLQAALVALLAWLGLRPRIREYAA
jgi:hypothetical protein